MPASFNKVILAGNLTRDPEFRALPRGNSVVARFTLAVNRTYMKDEEKREEVTYVEIEAFGKQAETINKYCKKGTSLLVEGRLRLEKWEDKTSGNPRSKLTVVLESFTFTGSPKSSSDFVQDSGSSEPSDYVPPARKSSSRSSVKSESSADIDDQDVPF